MKKTFVVLAPEALTQISGGAGNPPQQPSDLAGFCGPSGGDFAMKGDLSVKTPLGLTVTGNAEFMKCKDTPANPPATPGK